MACECIGSRKVILLIGLYSVDPESWKVTSHVYMFQNTYIARSNTRAQ